MKTVSALGAALRSWLGRRSPSRRVRPGASGAELGARLGARRASTERRAQWRGNAIWAALQRCSLHSMQPLQTPASAPFLSSAAQRAVQSSPLVDSVRI